MMAVLLAANAAVWLWTWRAFQGHPGLMAVAFMAWVFGLRHAADSDHIAAIDNVVRKLTQGGRRAWDAGCFFAAGHSVTVLILCVGVVAFPAMPGIENLRAAADMWGTSISALFLLLIGLANALTLWRLSRERNGGERDARPPAGVIGWVLRPVQLLIGRGWHMLLVGFLFGLGFDTASEVALLALTARQAASGLLPSCALVFPALFAAGMILVDTANSVLMTKAYGWGLRDVARERAYNIGVTALSVVVAVGVGGIELLGMLSDRVASVPFVAWPRESLPYLGYVFAALFLLLWGMAVLMRWVTGRSPVSVKAWRVKART